MLNGLTSCLLCAFLIFFGNALWAQQCTADAGSDTSICQGGSVVLNGSGTGSLPLNYSWSPASGLSCTNCANPTASPSSNQTYTLTITDQTGCIATSNVQVSLFTPSPASFTFVGNNNCANIPVQFTNTTPGTGLTYSWNFGHPASGADNTSNLPNPTHTFQWSGTGIQNFTVTLSVTSPGGCVSTTQQTVSILASPGPTLIDPANNFRNCGGSNFNMTVYDATPTTGNLNYRIIWGDNSADYISPTPPTGGVTHNYVTAEVFNLLYIVQGANGCIDTTLYQVSNITNPAIGAANPGGTTGCGPITMCFPLNNYSGNHNSTIYIVDFGDGTDLDTLLHPPPPTVCHTYDTTSCGSPGNQFEFTIRAINACDASETTISPIRIFLAPEPVFEADTGCVNQPITIENRTITGFNSSCSGSAIYNWDFGDGTTLTTVSNAPVTHTYTAPGNYTITLNATNNCATNTMFDEICIEEEPVPSFTASQLSGCAPFTTTIDNTTLATFSCETNSRWTVYFNGSPCLPSAGQFQFVGGTSETSLEPQIQFLDKGTYVVTLTMTNSCGVFEVSRDFLAQAPPELTLGPLAAICAGDSIDPVANNVDCLEPIDVFNWTFNGGTPSSSSSEIPGFITYPNDGNFSVQLFIQNLCGSATATASLQVNPTPPLLNPLVASPLCENDTANFTSDFLSNNIYSWTGPNGFSNVNQNFAINGLNQSDAGWYYLQGTLGQCTGPMDSVELTITVAPTVVAFPQTDEICYGDSLNLTASGALTYTWQPADSLNTSTGSSVIAFPSQTTDFVVFGSDGICIGLDTVHLVVYPLPPVVNGPDTTLCDQPIGAQLTAQPAGGVWQGMHIDANGVFTPNGVGVFPIMYTVTTAKGCIDSAERIVEVIEEVQANAGADTAVCFQSGNVVLTGDPTSGVWSGPHVQSNGTFSPNAVGTFQLTYSVGIGTCMTQDLKDVTVHPLPFVNAGNDTAVCVDQGTFQFMGNPLNGLWNGTGITNTNGTFDPSLAGPGNHPITLTATDATTGCQNTDQLMALVNDLPLVEAGNDTTICNQSITVSFQGSPLGGTWFGPNISSSGDFTPTGVGNFKVYYHYIAGTNCENLDSLIITVTEPIPSDAGPNMEACLNDPPIQLNGSPASGTWAGTNISSNGVFQPIQADTFLLNISNGVGNCFTSDTMEMIVHDLLPVDAGLDQFFCVNDDPVNLIASPLSGSWTGPGISNSSLGTFEPALAQVGNHTLVYHYTDPLTSCINRDTLLAQVSALPVPSFNYDTLTCVGDQETFTNTSSNTLNSHWNFGDGATSTQNTPSHTYTAMGFYNVQLIAESGVGCLDTLVETIEVREPPIASFSLAPDSACAPVMVSFNNQSSGIDVSYFWQFGNGSTSNAQNPAPQTFMQGFEDDSLYTVYLTVSNICGVRLDSATVRVMPQPVAVFAPETDITCDQFPLEFVNNSYGLPDGFEWDFGNGMTSTTSDTVFTQSFAGNGLNDTSYTIRLIASNECGKDTAYHTIYIYPSQVNAFFNTNQTEGCAPLTVQFSNFSQGETSSSWDLGDGNLSNSYNVTHTYPNPGTYIVSLFANNGCDFDTTTTTITVHPDPLIDFSFSPDSVCINESIQFTNVSANTSGYQWDFGDGSTSTLTNPSHQYSVAGNYTVTLVAFSQSHQCSTSVSKNVPIKQGPVAAFQKSPGFGCSPLQVNFTNQSTNTAYVAWDFGNGNTAGGQTASQIYDSLGFYQIQMIAYSANGCTDTIGDFVSVYQKPSVSFLANIVDSCADNLQAQFQNTSSGAINYSWNFGDGQQSSNNNPSHTYNGMGPFTVQLIGQNVQGCSDTMVRVIQSYPTASATMSVDKDTVCFGQAIEFTAVTQNADSLLWIFGDGSASNQNPVSHIFPDHGNYNVTLISYGRGGCHDTTAASFNPIVIIKPIADFTYSDLTADGILTGTIAFQNQSQNASSYYWDFGNGTTSTETNPNVGFSSATEYEIMLIANSYNGCADTTYETIEVGLFYGLFLPNAMNPGNLNASLGEFRPTGVGMAEFELWIYDTWGNLIWYTNALDADGRPTEVWKGIHDGQLVQQDSYVWKARAVFKNGAVWEGQKDANGRRKKAGTITIIH